MADYPYAIGTGKLPKLFETVGSKGVPEKVTNKWLEQYGFTSTNDRRLRSILEFLGFVGDTGQPTDTWKEYRSTRSREILANAIRKSYSELYNAYPEADQTTTEELASFFKSNSKLADSSVNMVVSTFRSLVGLADFSASSSHSPAPPSSNSAKGERSSGKIEIPREKAEHSGSGSSDITINLNVQLTLPETTDPEVYEALFKALNKHVLSQNGSE